MTWLLWLDPTFHRCLHSNFSQLLLDSEHLLWVLCRHFSMWSLSVCQWTTFRRMWAHRVRGMLPSHLGYLNGAFPCAFWLSWSRGRKGHWVTLRTSRPWWLGKHREDWFCSWGEGLFRHRLRCLRGNSLGQEAVIFFLGESEFTSIWFTGSGKVMSWQCLRVSSRGKADPCAFLQIPGKCLWCHLEGYNLRILEVKWTVYRNDFSHKTVQWGSLWPHLWDILF